MITYNDPYLAATPRDWSLLTRHVDANHFIQNLSVQELLVVSGLMTVFDEMNIS